MSSVSLSSSLAGGQEGAGDLFSTPRKRPCPWLSTEGELLGPGAVRSCGCGGFTRQRRRNHPCRFTQPPTLALLFPPPWSSLPAEGGGGPPPPRRWKRRRRTRPRSPCRRRAASAGPPPLRSPGGCRPARQASSSCRGPTCSPRRPRSSSSPAGQGEPSRVHLPALAAAAAPDCPRSKERVQLARAHLARSRRRCRRRLDHPHGFQKHRLDVHFLRQLCQELDGDWRAAGGRGTGRASGRARGEQIAGRGAVRGAAPQSQAEPPVPPLTSAMRFDSSCTRASHGLKRRLRKMKFPTMISGRTTDCRTEAIVTLRGAARAAARVSRPESGAERSGADRRSGGGRIGRRSLCLARRT